MGLAELHSIPTCLSELWWIKPGLGWRLRIASRSAASTKASVMCSSNSQPTMRREYKSINKAR
jgi:hypothetical protein